MERCCLQAATSMRCLLPSSERRAASPIPVNELPTHFRAHSLLASTTETTEILQGLHLVWNPDKTRKRAGTTAYQDRNNLAKISKSEMLRDIKK